MKKIISKKSPEDKYNVPVTSISANFPEIIFAKQDITKEEAFEIMQKNRFDVLPVIEKNGSFKKYFRTKEWGNFKENNIRLYEIKPTDCIAANISIKDALRSFAKGKNNFFFLKNKTEITGLINAANLNSKHVFIYLYNLISQLEFALGDLINKTGTDDDQLYEIFEEKKISVKPNTRRRREIKKGLDHKFVEFVYINDMAWIIKEKNLHKKTGITEKEFDRSIKLISKLRNIVAHPVNSLIKGKKSIVEIDLTISKIEILTEKIKSFLSK